MSAARDRLKTAYYNSREKTVANPGGMLRQGHRTNFVLALKDIGDVAQELSDGNDATLAAVVADNDATEAAIGIIGQSAIDAAAAANQSKVNAGTSEGNAAGSATTAGNAAADAKRTVANNFPDRLDATGSWFTEATTGDPGTVAVPTAAAISNVAGYGYEYTKANAQGQLFTKGVVSASSGKVYEVEGEVEWTVKGGAETPSFTVGVQGLDAAYANAGGQVQAALQAVGAIGVQTFKYRFGYAAPTGGAAWPSPGVSVWLRPYVLFNRKSDNSGAVTASTARVRRLTVRDVTAVVAAEIKAAEAAASAASVTWATQAQAEAGASPTGVMSPLLTAQAIAKQAVSVGGVLDFPTAPSANWLPCTGLTYLNASYPVLAPLMTSYTNPPTLRTTTGGATHRAAFGNSMHVMFGYDGTSYCCWTSPDTITWTKRSSPLTSAPTALAFGNGLFVVARASAIYKSADCITWTAVTAPPGSVTALAYANSLWVMGGIDGGSYAFVATAPADLSAWTVRAQPSSNLQYINAIAYNPTEAIWCAVFTGTYHWYSSNAAVTWSSWAGTSFSASNLVWAGTGFVGSAGGSVAVHPTGGASNPLSGGALPTGFGQITALIYDGANVLAASDTGKIAKSTDAGASWALMGSTGSTAITALTRSNSTATTPIGLAQGTEGIKSGLDASTTQFTTPIISARASNLNAYIKAA